MREPFYADSLTTLYHGDCLEVMAGLEPQSFDAVIADIPSGRTACAWDAVIPFEAMWRQLRRLTKKRGAIVLLGCTQPFTSALVMSWPQGFRYQWTWEKTQATGFLNAWRMPLRKTEDIPVFGDALPTYYPQIIDKDRKNIRPVTASTKLSDCYGKRDLNIHRLPPDKSMPTNLIQVPNSQDALHPTQKPLALMEYLVKTYTNEGDRVLDFTAGSGTTLRACRNLRRSSVGIEQDRHYCDVTVKRLAPTFEAAIVDNGAPLDALPLFAQEVAE
jgi:site-specific DNA-methyltransferase (adenine-specific)